VSLQLKKQHWSHRSSNYWEKSYPPKLIFRLNRDAAAQKLAFLGQEFDASSSLSARTLFELQQDSNFNANYHSAFINTYGYTYIALNTKPSASHHIAIADKHVRRALAYAVPVDQIIQMVNKGVNKRVAGPVSFLKKSCDTTLALIPFDPVKAGQLLAQAGWIDTDNNGVRDKTINGKRKQLEIELAYLSVQPEWKEMAIIIAEGLAQAGVKVNANGFDFPVWLEKLTTHDFDMAMGAWNSTAMPDDFSQLWSTTSYTSNGPNYTGFGNASSDALIDSINVIMDDEERLSLERRLQRIIYEEQPYIFLYGLVRRSVIHKRYDGAGFFAERPGILYNTLRVNLSGIKNTVAVTL
jgi:peptide/nickel transport system substrate-binding protein